MVLLLLLILSSNTNTKLFNETLFQIYPCPTYMNPRFYGFVVPIRSEIKRTRVVKPRIQRVRGSPGDQEEGQKDGFETEQINPKLGVGLLNRESVGFKASSHQTTKLEIHLLLGLGARFQKLSTESSITDGNCGILIKNNEGSRLKQENDSQHGETWVTVSIFGFQC